MKRAIAYVSDIILGRTGEVISREEQRDRITKYAAEKGVEIVRWFEDRMYNEELMERAGVQALLACDEPVDMILVERVWSFSRSWPRLEDLFKTIDRKGLTLAAATTMWDCISQMARRRYDLTIPGPGRHPVVRREEVEMPAIRRPRKLQFTHLYQQAR
ncbi:MAG: recombinase family protein [Deltaproteobacteria bacterium]|nr:recombinase family protein [Deltaproteobacteria bacterium]